MTLEHECDTIYFHKGIHFSWLLTVLNSKGLFFLTKHNLKLIHNLSLKIFFINYDFCSHSNKFNFFYEKYDSQKF